MGSKNKIIPKLIEVIEALPLENKTMIDVFTGTTRVAQAFKTKGWTLTTSDLSWASEAYSGAFICNNGSVEHLQQYIDELNAVQPIADWLTNHYCDVDIEIEKRVYVTETYTTIKDGKEVTKKEE